jgi:hypothetical protein
VKWPTTRPVGASARLDHHFSRGRPPRAWVGHVDATALDELLAALGRAGFPAVPPMLPGYAEAFDLIDAVIRQLSEAAVNYPTKRGPVVHGAAAVQP